jgi:phage gp29-like protein
LKRLQPHERRHFGLDEEKTLYFQVGQMEEVPPYKFVHFVLGHRPKRPYGRGLLKSAYWPWRFKQMGYESWSMALDKLGVPSLAALLEGNIDVSSERGQDTLAKVRDELEKMANGGVGAFSGVGSIETVGGGDKAQGGQMEFMKFCNAEISKAIMTATLQLEEGREDAERGDTEVHDAAAEDVAQYVATKLEGRIGEQLIKPIVFLEFGEEALGLAPRLRWDFRERATFEEVKGAMKEGVPLSKNLLEQDYNLPVAEEGGDDAFVSKNVQPGPAAELADDGKKNSVIPDPSGRIT